MKRLREINSNYRGGFSMIELLIASMLSCLLLGFIMNMYWIAKRNYALEQAEATIQANANIAISILQQPIRLAGFMGCMPAGSSAGNLKLNDQHFSLQNSLVGYQGGNNQWTPALPALLLTKKPKTETDVISIWYRESNANLIWTPAELNSKHYPKNGAMLASSCNEAVLFENQFQQTTDMALKSFPVEIAAFNYLAFYIGLSSHRNKQGQPIYGLHRSYLWHDSREDEMVEGIEDMKITYGVQHAKQQQPTFYLASQVQAWQDVKIIRIALLVTSIDEVLDKPQAYRFAGEMHPANDRMLRREWITYITLRGR